MSGKDSPLFQPIGDRASDHGHGLERPPLLRPEVLRWATKRPDAAHHRGAARRVGGNDPAAGEDKIFAAVETTVAIPWTVSFASPAKGIVHVPAHNTPMKPGRRELMLIAIAKARRWIRDVARGHSFADIARREGKAERHIRHLAPLAFVSPRIITAIMPSCHTPGPAKNSA
jgi:hypothetical protein